MATAVSDTAVAATSATTTTAADSDEEDRPTIFLRNFAEITEQGDSDSDDEIVVLEDRGDSSGRFVRTQRTEVDADGSSKVLKTYSAACPPTARKPLVHMITFNDALADLEMTSAEEYDPIIISMNDRKSREHTVAKSNFLTVKRALMSRRNRLANAKKSAASVTKMPPQPVPSIHTLAGSPRMPVVQAALQRIPIIASQMAQNAAVKVTSVPGLNPISIVRPLTVSDVIINRNRSLLQPGTSTTISNLSATPRMSTSTSAQQANIVSIQPMPQLIYDPNSGLLLYPATPVSSSATSPQVLRGPMISQSQPRLNSPQATLRFENGMVLKSPDMSFSTRPQHHNVRLELGGPNNQILNFPKQIQYQNQRPRVASPPVRPAVQITPPRPPVYNPRTYQQQQSVRQPTLVRPPQPHNVSLLPVSNAPRTTANILSNRPNVTMHKVNGQPPVAPLLRPPPPVVTTSSTAPDLSGVTAGNQKPVPGTVQEVESDFQNKTFPSLVVHVKTCLKPKLNRQVHTKARSNLDASVKSVLVHTPAKFTEWLMRRGLLKLEHSCDIHSNRNSTFKLGIYSDISLHPFSGGYVWTSDCCPEKRTSVFNGSIFEGAKYPPGTVLKLIYHWACQTPASSILQWVKVTSLFLKNFFTLLRAICISWLHESCPPLGGEMKYVEIGVITLGSSAETSRGVKNVNVEILGVFDPATKIVRMKVINSLQGLFKGKSSKYSDANEQGARAFQILWPLTHWVDKRSILLVDGIIDRTLFHELGFKNIQQCGESAQKSSATNVNIMNYLRHVVPKMFSSTLSVLSKSIVQQFLDELSWREMYGGTVYEAYENLLDHASAVTKWKINEPLISRLYKINQNPFTDWSNTKQNRRSPLNTIPMTLRSEPGIRDCIRHILRDDGKPTTAISTAPPPITASMLAKAQAPVLSQAEKRKLNEIKAAKNYSYYKLHVSQARKELSLQKFYYAFTQPRKNKPYANSVFTQNVKCPLCARTFNSNRDIIRHIILHVNVFAQNFARGSDTNICMYCLKEPTAGQNMAQHIAEVHKLEGVQNACRICQERFSDSDELTMHMWDMHQEAECPYACDICDYSSSFHYEVVDHFHKEHHDLSFVMCPYCLKILSAKSFVFLKTVVVHLQSHQLKRTKHCNRCVLQFGNDTDLRSHLDAHASKKTSMTPWFPHPLLPGEETILMAVPPASKSLVDPPIPVYRPPKEPPAKKPKLNLLEKKKVPDPKSTLNTSFSVPINTNEKFGGSKYKVNITNVEAGKATCVECLKDITTPGHFIGRLICTKCRFITACQESMEIHHQRNHQPDSKVIKPGIETKPAKLLGEPLVCKCGFLSRNPYMLATHLTRCEKITVFPKNRTPLYTEVMGDDKPPSLPLQQEPPLPDTESNAGAASSSSTANDNPITTETADLIASLDVDIPFSLDASLEAGLSLPPVLSPPPSAADSSLTSSNNSNNDGPSSQTPVPTEDVNNVDATGGSKWDDTWELPLSSLIAKCT